MDVHETIDIDSFRQGVREWLAEHFPAALAGREDLVMPTADGPGAHGDLAAWTKAMGEVGWGTPTWPREYGGGGLSVAQARILQDEMRRIGAFSPFLMAMGATMVGPTILDYGTEEQKRQHLPPICRGELRWCVGYSEPNAGSDLASLQTRCEDAGDHWVINGSKIWTSGANYADWCGALVRTDPSAKKHEGISFILINMRQPGVETRPIRLIGGASLFCETFFTDAIASKDAILGEVNRGWTVGKRLLQHERSGQTGGRSSGRREATLPEVARRYLETDADGRLVDKDLRTRMTQHLIDERVHNLTLARAAAEAKEGATNATSVLKNSATHVAQTRAELLLEIMGHQALGWEGEGFAPAELEATRSWLGGKAMSIYGGSFEVQNNIISKRILGLPDTTQSS